MNRCVSHGEIHTEGRTIRHQQLMPPLIPSHTTPSSVEIKKNIKACFETIKEYYQSAKSSIRFQCSMKSQPKNVSDGTIGAIVSSECVALMCVQLP